MQSSNGLLKFSVDRTFGFSSTIEAAQNAIRCAKTEATCNQPNGIGIVKLFGRSAGYIAAFATLGSLDVDLCLIPEVPVVLDGPDGCLSHIYNRVKKNKSAVIVVAEGAGKDLMDLTADTPSIGEFMKESVEKFFEKKGEVATVKYIDPSYMIRSAPANAADSIYSMQLAQNAVHGAMAGYSGFSIGLLNNKVAMLPIERLVETSPTKIRGGGKSTT